MYVCIIHTYTNLCYYWEGPCKTHMIIEPGAGIAKCYSHVVFYALIHVKITLTKSQLKINSTSYFENES